MKKLLSWTIIFAILAIHIPVMGFVEGIDYTYSEEMVLDNAGKGTDEYGAEQMQEMIKAVKPRLEVSEDCTEFDWNYNSPSYYRNASWRLSWSDKQYTKEYYVVCDTKGNITSYSFRDWSDNSGREIALPKYTKKELAETAKAFLRKLCPEAAEKMQLVNSNSSGFYSKSYIFYFERYENEIPVPDDTASVTVNYITGKPTALSCNFNYNVDFDKPSLTLDEDKAKKTLIEAQEMILSYRLKNEYDDNGKITERKAYLVYTPSVRYLSVDANTQELYLERNTWNVNTQASDKFGVMQDSAAGNGALESERAEYELTPEELAQIEVLDNLITKQEAVELVVSNEYLFIDKQATAVKAELRQITDNNYYYNYADAENRDKDLYKWVLNFSAPYEATVKNGYFSPYMNAVVDAQTGEIISFSANTKDHSYYEAQHTQAPELKYTTENAQELFTAFAKTQIPELVEDTRVSNTGNSVVIKYVYDKNADKNAVYRNANINLVRVNEGVDFTYNNISGGVDLVTGKITRFSYNWYENVVFESPKQAITPDEAYMVLLNSDGFGLNYEINSDYTYNKYLEDTSKGTIDYDELYTRHIYSRLVYSGYNYIGTTVSAIGGEIIDYNANALVREKEYDYKDIQEHWAQADISTLCDLGFAFDKEYFAFKPEEYITIQEYTNLLNFFNQYPYTMMEENDSKTESFITRTQAVKYIIDAAGYYKIAQMPDIFITDFADNSELAREDVGFIAIARGLGFVQGSANTFRPYEKMTRAEAVTMVFNFIKALN